MDHIASCNIILREKAYKLALKNLKCTFTWKSCLNAPRIFSSLPFKTVEGIVATRGVVSIQRLLLLGTFFKKCFLSLSSEIACLDEFQPRRHANNALNCCSLLAAAVWHYSLAHLVVPMHPWEGVAGEYLSLTWETPTVLTDRSVNRYKRPWV